MKIHVKERLVLSKSIKRLLCRVIVLLLIIEFVSPGLFIAYEAEAADNTPPPSIFEKTYGSGLSGEEAYDVVVNSLGGYAFVGSSYENGKYQALITITDKDGNETDRRIYSYNNFSRTELRSIDTIENDPVNPGYITAGLTQGNINSKKRMYVLRTNSYGQKIWEYTYGFDGGSWQMCQAFSVKETKDLGFIVAGCVQYNNQTDLYLVKLDRDGNKLWERTFGASIIWEWGYSVQETRDSGFIIAGSTDDARSLLLIKTDANGGLRWQKIYSKNDSTIHAKCVQETSDKGLIVSGYTGTDMFIMKLKTNGSKRWEKNLGPGIAYGVTESANGGFMVVGGMSGVPGVKIVRADSSGKKVWEKIVGDGGDIGHAIAQDPEGCYIIAGTDYYIGGSNAILIKLPQENVAKLSASCTNVKSGGSVLFYTTAYKPDGKQDTSGELLISVRYNDETGEERDVFLRDDGKDGDFRAKDGVYSGWGIFDHLAPAPITCRLYISEAEQDSLDVNIVNNPQLIVLTNYRALYNEFLDTGAKYNEDTDKNKVFDYYDAVQRISQYAKDHNGVVIDPSVEITVENLYRANYRDYSYSLQAKEQCKAIDELLNRISNSCRYSYVAIIGDDEVVPFYRRESPEKYEANYAYDNDSGWYGNPTLYDTASNYILTDIPYGSYGNTDPDSVNKPRIDAGVGRIFADKPAELINMIDGYEQSLDFSTEDMNAVIFGGVNEDSPERAGVNWPQIVNNVLVPALPADTKLPEEPESPPYRSGKAYFHDGTDEKWSTGMVIESVETAKLTLFWNHASHYIKTMANGSRLDYSHYSSMRDSAGHMLLSTGCHSGYSVSHNNEQNPSKPYTPYTKGLVNALLKKYVSYFAPSVYAIGENDTVAYHDLILQSFMKRCVKGNTTVGRAFVGAYSDFWGLVDPSSDSNINTYSTYGMVYYGLPTQRIIRQKKDASDSSSTSAGDADSMQRAKTLMGMTSVSKTYEFSLDIPVFLEKSGSDDTTYYEIPNGGIYLVNDFAPKIPMVTKTIMLLKGASIDGVVINDAATTTTVHSDVDLSVVTPINRTFGALSGTFAPPETYPEKLYWWTSAETEEGTELRVNITPMQYNNAKREATLYNHLEFFVSYTEPDLGIDIGDVQIFGGNPVESGMEEVPVTVNINSAADGPVTVALTVKDYGGNPLYYSEIDLDLVPGANNVELTMSTVGIAPGFKDAEITVYSGGVAAASEQISFQVHGITMTALLSQPVYYDTDSSCTATIIVRNEVGDSVADLEDEFELKLDDSDVTEKTVLYDSVKEEYEISVPITSLGVGSHLLKITCDNGFLASRTLSFEKLIDDEPPIIERCLPMPYEPGVSINSSITISFDEEIIAGAQFEAITLTTEDSTAEIVTRIFKDELIIEPQDSLDFNETYIVTLPAGAVTDRAGNDCAPYSFRFSTSSEPDSIPPLIENASPPADMEGVSVGAQIHLRFSETVLESDAFLDLQLRVGDADIPFTAEVVWKTLTITPGELLPYDSVCEVILPENTVKDLAGNPNDLITISFTTEYSIDVEPPEIIDTYPSDGTVDVSLIPALNFLFSEIVRESTTFSDIKITRESDGGEIPCVKQINGSLLTIRPLVELEYGKTYTLTVFSDACEDLAGIQLDSDYSYSFTTVSGPDIIAPGIVRYSPSDKALGVCGSVAVIIEYDELIGPGSAYEDIVFEAVPSEGEPIPVSYTSQVEGSFLTLTPVSELDYNVAYRVSIPSQAVADIFGNQSQDDLTIQFETGDSPDTTPPQIYAVNPVNEAAGVNTGASLYVVFDESIKQGESFADIELMADSINVDVSVTVKGDILVIESEQDLPYNAVCRLVIPVGAITDIVGNAMDVQFEMTFATMGPPDTTPPGLTSTVPGEGIDDVRVSAPIMFMFNESIKRDLGFDAISIISGEDAIEFTYSIQNSVLILTPVSDLPYDSEITVTLPQNAVQDLAGNNPDDGCTLSFTTEEAREKIPPVIEDTYPTDGAENINVSDQIFIVFDESIQPGENYDGIRIFVVEDELSVAVEFTKEISGKTLIITPDEKLPGLSQIQLVIPEGAVSDLFGNLFEGEALLSFTTDEAPDDIPPAVLSTSPGEDETDVSIEEQIVVIFDDTVLEGDAFGLLSFADAAGNDVDATVLLGESTLTIIPESKLQYNTTYVLTLPVGVVTDSVGNPQAAFVLSFTTEKVPTPPPPPPPPPASTETEPRQLIVDKEDIQEERQIIVVDEEDIQQGIFITEAALRLLADRGWTLEIELPSCNLRIDHEQAEQMLVDEIDGGILIGVPEEEFDSSELSELPDYLIPVGELLTISTSAHATLSIPIEDFEDIEDPMLLQFYCYDGSEWVFVGGNVNLEAGTIELQMCQHNYYWLTYYTGGFSDIADHWGEMDILRMAARHICRGYPDDSFRPDNNVLRSEMLSFLSQTLKLMGYATDDYPAAIFSDVSRGEDWFAEHLDCICGLGLMVGYPDGTFRAEENITREQAAATIIRLLALLDVEIPDVLESDVLSPFIDSDDISSWALEPMAQAVELGIMQGWEGRLRPKDPITRAEMVTVIQRVVFGQ